MLLNNIVTRTLDNGLKIIALRKMGAPIVSVQVWYNVGSVQEHDGIRGIAHLLEHMMFRGSVNVKSEEHARKINDVGGHSNAFTTEDVTAYTNSVPLGSFKMVLDLEADRMDGLTIDPELFAVERNVIIEEYHTYMNNPVAKAFLEFRQEFFKGHPYTLSPLGLLEDLQKVTPEDCRGFYNKWYSPSNAVIVIVGDIDEAEAIEATVSRFGTKLVRGEKNRHLEVPVPVVSANRMHRRVEFDVPVLIAGFPAPPSSSKDVTALEILQMVLSGGESSRLHRNVVRKEGAAVMAGGMNHLMKKTGLSMFFSIFTPDVAVSRVEKSLLNQIRRIKNEGISAQEMEMVKNATLTSRTFELYSAEHICNRIGFAECVEGDYRLWVERLNVLRDLDITTLTAVAKKYWNEENMSVLHLQPKRINPLLYVGGILRRIFGIGK
ncbi:MAG TPA: pitrilysin family protein [Chitinispirillaceae bacterium]|nr:pitrilysin family protein [Chitinispirillaceae bacterium]